MPVQRCQQDGKPGFKWGKRGKCYTYNPNDTKGKAEARLKAETQGRAIEAQDNA